MRRLPTPRSSRLRSSLPPIAFEVHAPRRLRVATVVMLACSVLLAALVPTPAVHCRVFGMILVFAPAWRPLAAIAFRTGAAAIYQVLWRADGTWAIRDAEGWREASLCTSTAGSGSWVLLAFRGTFVRRAYALIDEAGVGA